MSEPRWVKGGTTAGKFPEKAFHAVLKAIYPGAVGEKETPALKLDFADDVQLAIFGLDKIKGDGTVPAFHDIGKFLDSLLALKIEVFWAFDDDGSPIGFKTEPDLAGCKLFMKPEIRKGDIGSEWEGREFKIWIVEKYEKVTSTPGETVKETKKKPKEKTEVSQDMQDHLLETITKPVTISELWAEMKKKDPSAKVSDARAFAEQFMTKDGDKYTIA